MNNPRKYDIVIFGASGTCGHFNLMYIQYLMDTNKLNGRKIAIAGRSKSKLEAVRNHYLSSSFVNKLDIIIASIEDYESIVQMCLSTKVVVTSVGPYMKYGEPVFKACAATGTHYVDITGEYPFIDFMKHKYEEQAIKNKSVLISYAGYDSTPSVNAMRESTNYFNNKYNEYPSDMEVVLLNHGNGMAPRGTLPSLFNLLNNQWVNEYTDKSVYKYMQPYFTFLPKWDTELKTYVWISPFFYGNSHCVANAIKNQYSDSYSNTNTLRYTEVFCYTSWFLSAFSGQLLLLLIFLLLVNPISRTILEYLYEISYSMDPNGGEVNRFVIKAESRDKTGLKVVKHYHAYLGDPGLTYTSKAMLEAGFYLADQFDYLKSKDCKIKFGFVSTEIVDLKYFTEFENKYDENFKKIQ